MTDQALTDVIVEAAWVRQLTSTWRDINQTYFRGQLRVLTLCLSDADSRLGLFRPTERVIELQRKMCREKPWGVVIEVLKHEMAHQYVHEVLAVHDETAHGPAFQQTCVRMGIDAASFGLPEVQAETPDSERARLLQRVSKLLALAQSQNQNEAQAAMSAAQRLMLKHNLEAVPREGPRGYSFRQLGKTKARVFEPERRVGNLLAEHFFVEAIWVPSFDAATGKSGRILEVCGTPENLAMAEYVHGFLTHTGERLWREHKKSLGIDSDRERMAYLAGVIQGFAETLAQKTRQHREEGLIWLDDADLRRFYRARHPHVRHTVHAGSHGRARGDGLTAGRQIVLNRPLHAQGNTNGRRLLLGGRANG